MGFLVFNPFPTGTSNTVGTLTADSVLEIPLSFAMGPYPSIAVDVSVKNDFSIVLNTSTIDNTITFSNLSSGCQGTILVITSLANQTVTFSAASGSWTVITDRTATTNPPPTSGSLAIYTYNLQTVAGTNYIIIGRTSLTPATYQSIFGSNLIEVWHADYGITTSSGAVSSWIGQKSGYNYQQANATLRPTYGTDGSYFNGKNVLKFTRAIGHRMAATGSIGTAGQSGYTLVVYRTPTATAPDSTNLYNYRMVTHFNSVDDLQMLMLSDNGTITPSGSINVNGNANNRIYFTGNRGAVPTVPFMFEVMYDPSTGAIGGYNNVATSNVYNGAQNGTQGVYTTSYIGADPGPANGIDMSLALVIMCSAPPTLAQRNAALALARSEWGF